MNIVYTHPISLFCLALSFFLLLLVLARRPAPMSRSSALLGLALFVGLPWMFGTLAEEGYGDTSGIKNVLAMSAMPFFIWGLVLGIQGDATAPGTRENTPLSKLRPVRFKRSLKPPPPAPPVSRFQPVWNTLVVMLLLYAMVGVRFGEHLRARKVVQQRPSYGGPVVLLDPEHTDVIVAKLPQQSFLRPGEEGCTSASAPNALVAVTVEGHPRKTFTVDLAASALPGSSDMNRIENSWLCSKYHESPAALHVTEAQWQRWLTPAGKADWK